MARRSGLARILLTSSLIAASGSGAQAAEGGVSHYLPGIAGDLGFALPPRPGLEVTNFVWSHSGEVDATVLAGEVAEDVEVETILDVISASYATEARLFGGTYSFGAILPLGRTELSGELASGSFDEERFGVGDITLVPLQLNWSRGNFHFEFTQSIIAPTGTHDEDEIANIGRGYWSFDTIGAVTWMKRDWGTEVSFAWGLMHNAENPDNDYRTHNESHFDWAVNQYLTDSFAVGLRGYRLNQLKADTGEGAILANAEGFQQGWGAGFVWIPAANRGQMQVAGKVMRDYTTRGGRFESEYAQLSMSWTF